MSIRAGVEPEIRVRVNVGDLSAQRLDDAVARSVSFLLSVQHEDGYWLAELGADSTLVADYIFYLHVLGRMDAVRISKMAAHIRRAQSTDGGWNIFFGGPSEVNATVKAYFALRIAGDSERSEGEIEPGEGTTRSAITAILIAICCCKAGLASSTI